MILINRIFICGDTHGDIDIAKIKRFKNKVKDLDRKDYLIICGDVGCCWDGGRFDKYIQKYWSHQPFTVLFVDGNHENFNVLNSYPIENWHGGKVHKITDNLIHLNRGEIFQICNYSFLAFGGATSHDKKYRKENVTWWKEELPTITECNHALDNVFAYQKQIDFLISHSTDSDTLKLINPNFSKDLCTDFLKTLKGYLPNIKHYCGHYHLDAVINKTTILYNNIIEIDKG